MFKENYWVKVTINIEATIPKIVNKPTIFPC